MGNRGLPSAINAFLTWPVRLDLQSRSSVGEPNPKPTHYYTLLAWWKQVEMMESRLYTSTQSWEHNEIQIQDNS
jgi:hypothetical protein